MPEFWFIRHGESETNAGLPSLADQSTPITEKGKLQAEKVAEFLEDAPDLFVVSPYLRTQQTASPALNKFAGAPVETWDIQEYTYLGHDQYRGTTTKDRRKLSKDYFRMGDPDKVLGPGGESFNQFVGRVNQCFTRLLSTNANRIILFGHGWFIRAGLWLLYTGKGSIKAQPQLLGQIKSVMPTYKLPLFLFNVFNKIKRSKDMHDFLLFSGGIQTPNCGIIKFEHNQGDQISISGFESEHLLINL